MVQPKHKVTSLGELAALREELKTRARQQAEADRAKQQRAASVQRDATSFRSAVGEVRPIKSHGRIEPPPPSVAPIARQRDRDEAAALAESLSDDIDIERLLETDEALSYRRPGIDPAAVRRLRRGEWAVSGQIDLHGLRVDEAREALGAFLASMVRSERRCVRIIHGKGLGSVNKEPVLKGKVLKWLVQRTEVQAFCQARPNDGGSGALIVLLGPGPPNNLATRA
jgi:DNA-nicking Smr family endonuclease